MQKSAQTVTRAEDRTSGPWGYEATTLLAAPPWSSSVHHVFRFRDDAMGPLLKDVACYFCPKCPKMCSLARQLFLHGLVNGNDLISDPKMKHLNSSDIWKCKR